MSYFAGLSEKLPSSLNGSPSKSSLLLSAPILPSSFSSHGEQLEDISQVDSSLKESLSSAACSKVDVLPCNLKQDDILPNEDTNRIPPAISNSSFNNGDDEEFGDFSTFHVEAFPPVKKEIEQVDNPECHSTEMINDSVKASECCDEKDNQELFLAPESSLTVDKTKIDSAFNSASDIFSPPVNENIDNDDAFNSTVDDCFGDSEFGDFADSATNKPATSASNLEDTSISEQKETMCTDTPEFEAFADFTSASECTYEPFQNTDNTAEEEVARSGSFADSVMEEEVVMSCYLPTIEGKAANEQLEYASPQDKETDSVFIEKPGEEDTVEHKFDEPFPCSENVNKEVESDFSFNKSSNNIEVESTEFDEFASAKIDDAFVEFGAEDNDSNSIDDDFGEFSGPADSESVQLKSVSRGTSVDSTRKASDASYSVTDPLFVKVSIILEIACYVAIFLFS